MTAATEKIAKLLALAIDQEGTPEGTLARERADALMAAHGVSESECVDQAEGIAEEIRATASANWQMTLGQAAGRLVGVYVLKNRTRRKAQLHGFGTDTEREIWGYLWNSLVNQCNADANAYRRRFKGQCDRYGYPLTGRYQMRTFRNSWADAVCGRVFEILKARRKASKGNDGVEGLVPTSDSLRLNKDFAQDLYAGRIRSDNPNDRTGCAAGEQAGRRASFRSGVTGSRARALKA